MVDDGGGNARRGRGFEAGGAWPVGNDEGNLGGECGIGRRLDQGRHVGAAAGDEDGDPLAGHHARPRASAPSKTHRCAAARLDAAELDYRLAIVGEGVGYRSRARPPRQSRSCRRRS